MLPLERICLARREPSLCAFWTLEKDENMPEFFRCWVTTTLVSPQRRPEPPQLEPSKRGISLSFGRYSVNTPKLTAFYWLRALA